MYYIYILQSQLDNSLYKGLTDNLERRLEQHNAGRCQSTRSKLPIELVYLEAFVTRPEARMREKYFKAGMGREELHEMLELTK